MDRQVDIPSLPGYVSVEEAAKRLNISKTRLYLYVNEGRIRAVKAAHVTVIPLEEIEKYRRNITGRPRKSTPPWRIPPEDNDLYITYIVVQVLPGKMSMLKEKLVEIKQSDSLIFPGTIARYISASEVQPEYIRIELVWRGATVADQSVSEQELEAFRRALSDVLDWKTAQYDSCKMLMNT